MNTTLTFAGRTIDLASALPLRMRDHRALLRRGVNFDQAVEAGDVEALFAIALHILQQADPTVTEAELEALLPEQFVALWSRIAEVNTALKAADVPFGAPSTPSDAPSAGAPTTS